MRTDITIDKLFQCCEEIFPSGVVISIDFINSLNAEGIKSAFRVKAKEIHPDKLQNKQLSVNNVANRFNSLVDSYKTLLAYADSGYKTFSSPKTGKTEKHETADKEDSLFHSGEIPKVQLRFSQYLYYRGIISWNDCINSLVWQRKKRPVFGEIAIRKGFLDFKMIGQLLKYSRPGEKIGEIASRLKILNKKEISEILGNQMTYKASVGEFFVEKGFITREQLKVFLNDLYAHNQQIKRVACEQV